MGWLFGSGSYTSPSKKVFKTTKEIKKALYRIRSLKKVEREEILKEIQKQLDDGGVTVYEGQEKLNKVFYQMYKNDKISRTDYENLKKLWK